MEMARTKKLYQNDTLSQNGTVSQNGKRSRLVSLIPSRQPISNLSELIVEIKQAEKLSRLSYNELFVLILIADSKGLNLQDIFSLGLFHKVTILSSLNSLNESGQVHKDDTMHYHLTSLGAFTLRSCLPSFTFPLPRF